MKEMLNVVDEAGIIIVIAITIIVFIGLIIAVVEKISK